MTEPRCTVCHGRARRALTQAVIKSDGTHEICADHPLCRDEVCEAALEERLHPDRFGDLPQKPTR